VWREGGGGEDSWRRNGGGRCTERVEGGEGRNEKGEGEGGAGRVEVKVLRRIESVYQSTEYRVRDVKMGKGRVEGGGEGRGRFRVVLVGTRPSEKLIGCLGWTCTKSNT